MIPSSTRELVKKVVDSIVHDVELTARIENDIYNFIELQNMQCKSSVLKTMYVSKAFQVCTILEQNPSLQNQNVCEMSFVDRAPHRWSILEQDLKILNQKLVNDDEKVYTTSRFVCGVCKKRKCVYSEVQTRSCDEGSTIFVRCMNCGHHFRG